jgi:hypothetical protein
MKKTLKIIFVTLCAFALLMGAQGWAETLDTRIGRLEFTHSFADGYPSDATVQKLFDEMDFQRACQAYIWALPLVSMAQWQYAHNEVLGAKNGQIILFESYEDKLGGLTYNVTTPYALSFIDLSKEGPYVVEMPKGEVRGAAHDMWQIGISQITEPGKYLFIGPGQDVPEGAEAAGYKIAKSPTMNLLVGIRLMPPDHETRLALLKKIRIYPYAERKNPRPRGYTTPKGKPWLAAQPRGIEYWVRLADIINREPVFERDRFYMAMLKELGIEKGKTFQPDERQRKILLEATLVGEAMAKANNFAKRLKTSKYVEGSHWYFATVAFPDQKTDYYDQLDERAAWFYEAVTNDKMMHGQRTGKGQVYLATNKDKDGDWLDGGRNYVFNVPPNVPAEAFWSITIYDVDTRTIIKNKQQIADRSSRMELHANKNGSVTIYIGPDKPEGQKQKNWIPTVPGKAWFPYFRLYSPKKTFLDRTWVLPDIEKVK